MKSNFFENSIYIALIFTVCFPFVPQIVKSSDTQPLFAILIILYPIVNLLKTKKIIYFVFDKQIFYFLIFLLLILVLLFTNIFIFNNIPIFSRYFAFIQFLIAIFIGLFLKIRVNFNWIFYILIIYVLFTFIYFFTNGFVEDLLIFSRDNNSEDLINIGRGARTLSPEPSFFALHIFNLYVIYKLLSKDIKSNFNHKNLIIISLLLLSSLSGYGIAIFLFLILTEYPKLLFFSFLLFFIFSPLLINVFSNYDSIRSVNLIIKIITENPFSILETDASILSRLNSFSFYSNNIKENLIFGDNFSIVEGGGLIGVVSGIGCIGIIFLLILLFKIFLNIKNFKLLSTLLFWLIINFVSGPFGIATIGIIIGLIFRNKRNSVQISC